MQGKKKYSNCIEILDNKINLIIDVPMFPSVDSEDKFKLIDYWQTIDAQKKSEEAYEDIIQTLQPTTSL